MSTVALKADSMNSICRIAVAYAVVLGLVTALNYVPGLTDDQGRVFGIFALDLYDDLLHFASAAWAGVAAWASTRACVIYFKVFGSLYLLDGLLGLATGSGFLDLGDPRVRRAGSAPAVQAAGEPAAHSPRGGCRLRWVCARAPPCVGAASCVSAWSPWAPLASVCWLRWRRSRGSKAAAWRPGSAMARLTSLSSRPNIAGRRRTPS